MIVFTSDHGDYLGDHWMGEKELFHDASARIPLIIVDPSEKADATRGSINQSLTEAIDLVPTFLDFAGGEVPDHILEGYSLLPEIYDTGQTPRDFVISEYDYSARPHLRQLSKDAKSCSLTMVFDGRWKLIWVEGHRPMLYDLKTDPKEVVDLGDSKKHQAQIKRMGEMMFSWARQQHTRVAISDAQIETSRCHDDAKDGVFLGFWDETELNAWRKRQSE